MKLRKLDVFNCHRLRIARATLKMSEAGARVMGGMDHATARAVILELTGKPAKKDMCDDPNP